MFESMRQELSDKTQSGAQKGNAYAQQGQQIGSMLQSAGQVIQQGMSAYAQNKWSSMKYDLEQEALSGINDYLDVNNENASQDYNKWVTNLVNKRISEGGTLLNAYAKDQKQGIIDGFRGEFDKQFITAINNENQRLFKENEDNIINAWNTTRDISLFDSAEVFKLSFKNGMVVKEKVNLDSPYDETDDRTGDFNHLLNVLYQNACRITDTSSAKMYVDSNIDSIEKKCMNMDIAQLAEQLITDPAMTQSAIVDKISAQYSTDNLTPYTGRKITADEAYDFKNTVQQVVNNMWSDAENKAADIWNNNILTEMIAIEDGGSYVTTEVVTNLIAANNVDPRFVQSQLLKMRSMLMRNDAMVALDKWMNEGQPSDKALTEYMSTFVSFSDVLNQYVYNNNAGYELLTGDILNYRPSQYNQKLAEKYQETVDNETARLNVVYDDITTKGFIIAYGDTVYTKRDKNYHTNLGETTILSRARDEYISTKGNDELIAAFGCMSYDPLSKGLDEEDMRLLQARADKEGKTYWALYEEEYCDSADDVYDLVWSQLEALYADEATITQSQYGITTTTEDWINAAARNAWYGYINDFKAEVDQYNNDLGVLNGTVSKVQVGEGEEATYKYVSNGTASKSISADDIISGARTAISNAMNREPVGGGVLYNSIVKHMMTPGTSVSDIRDLANIYGSFFNLLNDEEFKSLNTMTSSQIAEAAMDNKAAFDKLDSYISGDCLTEAEMESAWMGWFNYLAKNLEANPSLDVNKLADTFISDTKDRLINTALNLFTSEKNPVNGILSTDGENFSGKLYDSVLGFAGETISGSNYFSSVYGLSGMADEFINSGGAGVATSMPASLLALTDPDTFNGTWNGWTEEQRIKNCLMAAYYSMGETGKLNESTDIDSFIKQITTTMYNDENKFRNTDDAYSEAAHLGKAMILAGELYSRYEAMADLNNPENGYNLGVVKSVNGNQLNMSSGVIVQTTGKKEIETQERGGLDSKIINTYSVVINDDNGYPIETCPVETFFSNTAMDGVKAEIENAVAAKVNGNIYRKEYRNASNAIEQQLIWASYKTECTNTLLQMIGENGGEFGRYVIEYDQNTESFKFRLSDKETSKWGFSSDEYECGWSVNGFDFNFDINSSVNDEDKEPTYKSSMPKAGKIKQSRRGGFGDYNYMPSSLQSILRTNRQL